MSQAQVKTIQMTEMRRLRLAVGVTSLDKVRYDIRGSFGLIDIAHKPKITWELTIQIA